MPHKFHVRIKNTTPLVFQMNNHKRLLTNSLNSGLNFSRDFRLSLAKRPEKAPVKTRLLSLYVCMLTACRTQDTRQRTKLMLRQVSFAGHRSQVTAHRSLFYQYRKYPKHFSKANLRPKNIFLGLIRPKVSSYKCLGYPKHFSKANLRPKNICLGLIRPN